MIGHVLHPPIEVDVDVGRGDAGAEASLDQK